MRQPNVISIRSHYRDRFDLLAQRQHVAVVLQQHQALASRSQGNILVGG
jgi:hypothetical protein